MFSFLTSLEVNAVCVVVTAVVCLSPLGTKITDFFKGVPSDLRTALSGVEATASADLKAKVKAAHAGVVHSLPIPAPKAPPPPAAPAAPVTAAVSATGTTGATGTA